MKQSNLAKGKKLEQAVYSLLNLSGYGRIQSETRIRGKKLDLFIETLSGISLPKKIAVECKNNERELTRTSVSSIISDYSTLFIEKEIDELLIVTAKGINVDGKEVIKNSKKINHKTFLELQNSIYNFSYFINSQIESYENSDVSKYYIPITGDKGLDIENYILNTWLKEINAQPLAIIGSYGQGKSTLAKKIAFELSKRYLRNPANRIPILIELGSIITEQSVGSIMASLFTETLERNIGNYSFPIFMDLNKRGRFVLILDGFDEMRQSLNRDAFNYIMSELNKLVTEKSKVILLGRPTVFLDDDEYKYIIKGKNVQRFKSKESHFSMEGSPVYNDITIDALTVDQIKLFLNRYNKNNQINLNNKSINKIKSLEKRLSNEHILDITRRPVQLKMLVEILPEYKGSINNITSVELYNVFIDYVLTREIKKKRLNFTKAERRLFAAELGWWLWSSKREKPITPSLIPDSIIRKFIKKDEDIESAKRDMVTACFLERRIGDSLHFPHRSFQEFLIAELIVRDYKMDARVREGFEINNILQTLSDQVFEFMYHMVDNIVLTKLDSQMKGVTEKVSLKFIKIFSADETFVRSCIKSIEGKFNYWRVVYLINYFNNNNNNNYLPFEMFEQLTINTSPLYHYREPSTLGLLLILGLIRFRSEEFLLYKCIALYTGNLDKNDGSKIVKGFKIINNTVDFSSIYSHLAEVLSHRLVVREWISEKKEKRITNLNLPSKFIFKGNKPSYPFFK